MDKAIKLVVTLAVGAVVGAAFLFFNPIADDISEIVSDRWEDVVDD